MPLSSYVALTGLSKLKNSICRWLCRLGLCLCIFIHSAHSASQADSQTPPQRKPLVLALASLTTQHDDPSPGFSLGHVAGSSTNPERLDCFTVGTRSRLRKTFDQTWRRLRASFAESSHRISSGLSRLRAARLIPFVGLGWRNPQDELSTEIADIDIGFFLDEEPTASMTPFATGQGGERQRVRRIHGRTSNEPDEGLTQLGQVRSEWDYRDSFDGLEILPTVSFGAVYRF